MHKSNANVSNCKLFVWRAGRSGSESTVVPLLTLTTSSNSVVVDVVVEFNNA